MSYGKNWVALSGMLLASCMLSSCDTPRALSSFMGEERTLPDGSEAQQFGAPRRPLLNPLGNVSSRTVSEGDRVAYSAPAKQTVSSNRERLIPRENIAMLSGSTPASIQMANVVKAAPTVAVETAMNDALTTPSNNAIALTPPSASVAAVDSAIQQPITVAKAEEPAPVVEQADVAETAPAPKTDIFAMADLPEPKAEPQAEQQQADAQAAPAAENAPIALMEPPVTTASSEPTQEQAPVVTAAAESAAQEPAVTETAEEKPSRSFFQSLASAVTSIIPDTKEAKQEQQQASTEEAKDLATVAPAAGSAELQQEAATILVLTPPSAPKPDDISAVTATIEQAAFTTSSAKEEETTAKKDEQASEQQPANGYPSLSSVPDAPVRTPASEIAADMQALSDNRDTTQASGQTLLTNPAATVMTSAQTGQMVNNAATAMPNLSPSAGGEEADLTVPPMAEERPTDMIDRALQTQAEKDRQAEAEAASAAAAAPVAAEPVAEAPAPVANTQTAETKTAFSVAESEAEAAQAAPVVAPAPVAEQAAPAQDAPAPLMAAAPANDVVRLRAPVSVPEYTPVTGTVSPDAPAQPSIEAASAGEIKKAVKMLPESRYAQRRLAPVNESY